MTRPCVHELFEAQAGRTPGTIAVFDDSAPGTELSYVELNGAANRMAHRLRALGVGPECPVGVCLHRGIDMVVALLAVLKAGGAYVPLDPDYPTDRLAHMLTDSAAPIVITNRALAPVIGAYRGTLVHTEDPFDGSGENPAAAAYPDNPAYVMYTSGSTGRPKGVVVPHAGVVNRILWGHRRFRLDATDRLLQKTPYSFDVSVPEFFWPLAVGATVVMARPGGHRDPAYLARVLTERRITTVHFVPSMLRAFLAEPFGEFPALRRMMCSGEALPADLVGAVHERIGCELYNLYGPTEASIEVTATRCHPDEPVTIGRAIDNTRTHVLDPDLEPVAAGAEGQLCLAGVQLARGYHNQPRLTAERFVPNPHATEPGERLYLTGDLVRGRPDGTIEYLGRLDNQVKIRGHRIELGEIESELLAHPEVRAGAVTVHRPRTGEPHLVAYLVTVADAEPDVRALRAHLGRRLPDHMIPAVFLTLPELPLTPSGKTDRAALPEPDGRRPALGVAYVPARTPTQAALAETWESVLGVRPIGIRDPFLELGGQSLTAARICARVRDRFGAHLSAGDLLDAATVEAMAILVDIAPARPGPPPLTRLAGG